MHINTNNIFYGFRNAKLRGNEFNYIMLNTQISQKMLCCVLKMDFDLMVVTHTWSLVYSSDMLHEFRITKTIYNRVCHIVDENAI